MRILVVEDEKKVASFLRQALTEAGYTVDVAHDGEAGLAYAQSAPYDLILLDHLLPHLSGRALCERLRQDNSGAAILLVTACATVEDTVAGLDAGADDYLTKPFSLDELLARVRALLRRTGGGRTAVLTVADLTLDPHTRQVQRAGQEITLSAREYALLEYLMRNAQRPLARALIAEHVWGFDFDSGSNVIDVYINYLRAKIDRGHERKLIQTLRNVGYQFG